MMQRFAFLLLVASVALLGAVVPVQSAFITGNKRETNAQRLSRGLPPLAPVRRSPTDSAMRRQVSPLPGSDTPTGRLQVRMASGGNVLGYVFNAASGPTGLNLVSNPNPPDQDLRVQFTGSSLLGLDPQFGPPYYVSGNGTAVLSPQNLNTVQFTNVDASVAQGWSLDTTTGQLNWTRTNPDGSKSSPTLIYDDVANALNFTLNPTGLFTFAFQVPCTIYLTK